MAYGATGHRPQRMTVGEGQAGAGAEQGCVLVRGVQFGMDSGMAETAQWKVAR